jgi:hypothetical protein
MLAVASRPLVASHARLAGLAGAPSGNGMEIPRLRDLIEVLHGAPDVRQHRAIMRRYQSEILE